MYYDAQNTLTYEDGDYSGYTTSGFIFDASVCVIAKDTKYFCNTAPSEFYAVDSIYSNNWNAY